MKEIGNKNRGVHKIRLQTIVKYNERRKQKAYKGIFFLLSMEPYEHMGQRSVAHDKMNGHARAIFELLVRGFDFGQKSEFQICSDVATRLFMSYSIQLIEPKNI